jgi:hypothetical protein
MTTDEKVIIIQQIKEIYLNSKSIDLRTNIEKHFLPSKDEKWQNAEIPTPVVLIDEMLDTIPIEFWTKPQKVFEPCCGKGNFVLGIFDKFYDGLKNSIPNIQQRCDTIITKCLYYADLTPLNVFITTQLLLFHINSYTKCDTNNISFNNYVGDTLSLDIRQQFNISAFDAVIGNPPYNKSKGNVYKGGHGGKSLWDKFVLFTLENLLVEYGYLLFVHPPSWRKPEHYLWKIMSNKQIVFLKSYSENDGINIFGCATTVDYYLLENAFVYKNTIFYGQDGITYHIKLNNLNFLPSGCVYEIQKILGTNNVIYSRSNYGTDKKNVIYSSSYYDTRKDCINTQGNHNFIYPVVHGMTKKNGLVFVYSNEDKGHFGVSKVILSFGRHQYPYNDWEGKYGMSHNCYGIEIQSKEDGDCIVKAINSNKFKQILKYTKWSTFQTDWRMFKYFKVDFWREFI